MGRAPCEEHSETVGGTVPESYNPEEERRCLVEYEVY